MWRLAWFGQKHQKRYLICIDTGKQEKMDKASKALRRSGVRIRSIGSGHSDLQMVIAQLKDVRTTGKVGWDSWLQYWCLMVIMKYYLRHSLLPNPRLCRTLWSGHWRTRTEPYRTLSLKWENSSRCGRRFRESWPITLKSSSTRWGRIKPREWRSEWIVIIVCF